MHPPLQQRQDVFISVVRVFYEVVRERVHKTSCGRWFLKTGKRKCWCKAPCILYQCCPLVLKAVCAPKRRSWIFGELIHAIWGLAEEQLLSLQIHPSLWLGRLPQLCRGQAGWPLAVFWWSWATVPLTPSLLLWLFPPHCGESAGRLLATQVPAPPSGLLLQWVGTRNLGFLNSLFHGLL